MMIVRTLFRILAPLVFGLSLTACEKSELSLLVPQGEYDPAQLEFGEVSLGLERILTAEFKNVGQVAFKIDEIVVPRDAGFVLKAPTDASTNGNWDDPNRLPLTPGASYVFEVGYSPTVEGFVPAELVVKTGDYEFALGLSGTGVIRAVPLLKARPNPVNFGRIPVNTSGMGSLELLNEGTGPAVITEANFNDASSDYRIVTPLPITVAAGGRSMVDLVFTPSVEGSITDTLTMVVTDHDLVGVAMFGEGLLPLGDVTCNPAVLNFGPVERGNSATRSVTCVASGGSSRIVSGRVNSPDGGFTAAPQGTVDLSNGEEVTLDVTYTAQGLPRNEDGTYTVQYSGDRGVDDVVIQLTAEVVPPPATETAITVNMRWDRNDTDVDLHLVGPGGTPFMSPMDCFYLNETPDWGRQGDTTDNPFLDDDDTDGLGPEEINLSEAAPGRYEVYVHYFSDHRNGDTNTTVVVSLAGAPVATVMRNLACNDMWHVGSVNWSGSSGTFSPSNGVTTSSEGSCR